MIAARLNAEALSTVEACVRVAEARTLGEAFDPGRRHGPSSRAGSAIALQLVDAATSDSHVTVAAGGHAPDPRGFFYPGTVLDGVRATTRSSRAKSSAGHHGHGFQRRDRRVARWGSDRGGDCGPGGLLSQRRNRHPEPRPARSSAA